MGRGATARRVDAFANVCDGPRPPLQNLFMSSLAVLHASELVTLSGPKRPRFGAELSEVRIVRDGGMLVRDGKIEKIGPSDEIEKDVSDAKVLDAGGRVVMPGFVDAHTHLVFAGNRLDDFERRARGESYEQISKGGGGNLMVLALSTLLFAGIHAQFWYEQSEQGRRFHR